MKKDQTRTVLKPPVFESFFGSDPFRDVINRGVLLALKTPQTMASAPGPPPWSARLTVRHGKGVNAMVLGVYPRRCVAWVTIFNHLTVPKPIANSTIRKINQRQPALCLVGLRLSHDNHTIPCELAQVLKCCTRPCIVVHANYKSC